MTQLNDDWFTEVFQDEGTAFSLKIRGRLHSERSQYQQIDIYDTETFGNLMVIDGAVMLTARDNFLYHEMMSHPALFTHKDPKKVVIVGGGDCGTLQEVLKHPGVEEAWQVEIDERVTRLSEKYFPELCAANQDPRANFFFGDGIQWMRDVEPNSLDVIIVDSTDPVGPGRRPVCRGFLPRLPDGPAPGRYRGPAERVPAAACRHHHQGHPQGHARAPVSTIVLTLPFPQPVYPTGWWSCTMGRKTGPAAVFP